MGGRAYAPKSHHHAVNMHRQYAVRRLPG